MTDPGIEIRWGSYDNYNEGSFRITDPEQREILRPKIQRAVGMAIEGLADYQVALTDRKYLDVYEVVPYYYNGTVASATTSKTMQLYLRPHQMGGHLDIGYMAHSVLHESLHAIRKESMPSLTVGELGATEGIAYVSEYLFKKKVPHWRMPTSIVDHVIALPDHEIATQSEELVKIMDEDLYGKKDESWLKPRRRGVMGRFHETEVIGIATVYRQVLAGREISELLRLPAAEVLGLES